MSEAGEGPTPGAWIFWLSAGFVCYTYLLYPLAIGVAARLRPRPVRHRPGHCPSISVVLAAYNEAGRIVGRLENLLAQQYPAERFEVIVVSDGSRDATAPLVRETAQARGRIRLIDLTTNQGKAAALNEGVTAATGELVVFADCRQRFAPDALARLAENFADPLVGAASGELVLVEPGAASEAHQAGVARHVGLYWRYEKWMRRQESAIGSMLGATGAIYAIRRALWRPLPAGALLDDFLTPMTIVLAGRRAIFDGRAVATDEASTRADQEWTRKVRTLAGNFQAFALQPALLLPWRNRSTWAQVWSHKVFRLLVPYALVGLWAGSIMAPGWFYGVAACAQALFYGAALGGRDLERRGRPLRSRWIGLALTFVALNWAAVAGLWVWLTGRDSTRIWRKAYAPVRK